MNFSSLENFLQRKQKTGRTRECISIFRASGGTNFEKFSKFGCGFDGFTSLPNVIYIYIYIQTMGNRILKCLISCVCNAVFRHQFVIYST